MICALPVLFWSSARPGDRTKKHAKLTKLTKRNNPEAGESPYENIGEACLSGINREPGKKRFPGPPIRYASSSKVHGQAIYSRHDIELVMCPDAVELLRGQSPWALQERPRPHPMDGRDVDGAFVTTADQSLLMSRDSQNESVPSIAGVRG